MVAIELGLCTTVAHGQHDTHFVVCSDIMGVIGALHSSQSSNLKQNHVLQRIVALMCANSIWITLQYMPSADSISNLPSCGLAVPGLPWLNTHTVFDKNDQVFSTFSQMDVWDRSKQYKLQSK
jgi:hypothetical protein